MFKLLLICGGPGAERNISLNSCRSVYDNIYSKNINVDIIYVNKNLDKYLVDGNFLYSNTTSDFDFKLSSEGRKLNESEFLQQLKISDLVFPLIHGKYCEDGELQSYFERYSIPFVGSNAKACNKMYNKQHAEDKILKANNLMTIPKIFISSLDNSKTLINEFFSNEEITDVVVKPIEGGSSFGVYYAKNKDEAEKYVNKLLNNNISAMIEKRCLGREFTVIVLQNKLGAPIALIPTEIEVKDETKFIFDTRRKYLATNETHYFCPPRFSKSEIESIREKAQLLFSVIGASDFIRIDGWIFDDGCIYFSDFNPISGMEQNSFIFQQAAKIGFTHETLINHILNSACKNNEIDYKFNKEDSKNKKKVNVLFGGITSERQVSLMSGSNVWLKLLHSEKYKPYPYLLFEEEKELFVLSLPYEMVLNHTTEEIEHQFKNLKNEKHIDNLVLKIKNNLEITNDFSLKTAEKKTLTEFINICKNENSYVFLGLHGGFGEDGSIQKMLEKLNVSFNGSGSMVSKVCMNKFTTGLIINEMNLKGVRTARKKVLILSELKSLSLLSKTKKYWNNINDELKTNSFVIKPKSDGCSTGVIVLKTVEDLNAYANFVKNKALFIPKNTFYAQNEKVALNSTPNDFIIEEYIEVDNIKIKNKELIIPDKLAWVELTCGVFEKRNKYHSFNPSITIADSGAVLTVEEKFQGGTGINITPPPESIINSELLKKIKKSLEKIAAKIGIKDYCRIDIFANNNTNEIIIIEINSLPGLSPSTVLFQQGVKEEKILKPLEFLEKIIEQ